MPKPLTGMRTTSLRSRELEGTTLGKNGTDPGGVVAISNTEWDGPGTGGRYTLGQEKLLVDF